MIAYRGKYVYDVFKIEDLYELVNELSLFFGTTRTKIFDYDDNHIILFSPYSINVVIDKTTIGQYLTILTTGEKDVYRFALYREDEFFDNFIFDIEYNKKNSIISLEYFKDTLDFIKNQDEKMNNFCNALEQLSPGEYCNCFLYTKYEKRLLEMLCKAMNLSESKQEDLYYWLYNAEWGTKFKIGDIVDNTGDEPKLLDLTSIEKLYNYLVDKGDN